jgi:predicted PurR-regulated permease PerM
MKSIVNKRLIRAGACSLTVIMLILSVFIVTVAAKSDDAASVTVVRFETNAAESSQNESNRIHSLKNMNVYSLQPISFLNTKNEQSDVKAEISNESETNPETPQTSNSNMTGFFIGLGALALGGIVAFLILFLKRKKNDGDDD